MKPSLACYYNPIFHHYFFLKKNNSCPSHQGRFGGELATLDLATIFLGTLVHWIRLQVMPNQLWHMAGPQAIGSAQVVVGLLLYYKKVFINWMIWA